MNIAALVDLLRNKIGCVIFYYDSGPIRVMVARGSDIYRRLLQLCAGQYQEYSVIGFLLTKCQASINILGHLLAFAGEICGDYDDGLSR